MFHLSPPQVYEQNAFSPSEPDQLHPDLFPPGTEPAARLELLEKTVTGLDQLYGIGCVVDVVLSHLAVESSFWQTNPEATYNTQNCRYLQVAYELDEALASFSEQLSAGTLEGFEGNEVGTETQLQQVMGLIKRDLLPSLKLHEFFQLDAAAVLASFTATVSTEPTSCSAQLLTALKQHGLEHFIRRYALLGEGESREGVTVDCDLVWAACRAAKLQDEAVLSALPKTLKRVNAELMARLSRHQAQLLRNLASSIRYYKLSSHHHEVSPESPLFPRYFYYLGAVPVLQHGFVLEADSTHDPVAKDLWHTLTRTFVINPEAIRLRYRPDQNEAEWLLMTKYVTSMARIFKGIRVEDAGNTPVEVLDRLLTAARRGNPDVMVFAADVKAATAARLAVTRVIRDAASDSANLPRLIQGTMQTVKSGRELEPTFLPILLADSSPFSQTPAQRGCPEDALPLAALIAFAPTIIGSSRGTDIILPYQPQPSVQETRHYFPQIAETLPVTPMFGTSAESVEVGVEYRVTEGKVVRAEIRGSWDGWQAGIQLKQIDANWYAAVLGFPVSCLDREYAFKFVLNSSHWTLSGDYPISYDSKGFGNNALTVTEDAYIRAPIGRMKSLEGLRKYLNGLHLRMAEQGYASVEVERMGEVLAVIRTNPVTLESFVLIVRNGQNEEWGSVRNWQLPGKLDRVECVAKLAVHSYYGKEEREWVEGLPCTLDSYRSIQWFGSASEYAISLDRLPRSFVCVLHTSQGGRVLESLRLFHGHSLPQLLAAKPSVILNSLSLSDIVYLLWRCSPEETALHRHSRDVYKVPGLSALRYAGLGGLALAFRNTNAKPYITENLLQGNWLIDYHSRRVGEWPLPSDFQNFYWKCMEQIKMLPRKYIPAQYQRFVLALYSALSLHVREHLFEAGALRKEQAYEDVLMACTPFYGTEQWGRGQGLAAGLPNNAFGSSRRRGRDTFIAFQGLFLATGRFKEAEREIVEFAGAVQEGVVPNHMCADTGTFEYHTRDTTWWFLRAVRDYVSCCGPDLLRLPVEPRFSERKDLTVADILQTIMQKHAAGVHFYNSLYGVWMQPNWNDIGADIHLDFDWETGLMMAGPHSHTDTAHPYPAQRDGAAIEVTALLFSAVTFLAELYDKSLFPSAGVYLSDGSLLRYSDWASRIQLSFEPLYWWPVEDICELMDPLAPSSSGFYKDTVGAAAFELETVLRPNQCLAMAIAPELFDPDHAYLALQSVDKALWDGAGLRLDATSRDSALWITGFYVKAKARFHGFGRLSLLGLMKTLKEKVSESLWLGVPSIVLSKEVNGTEARSIGALVEALDFVHSLDN